ncbi:MAG: UTP--glucose-1-phosphate uridylyltransferase GalU [Pseudomonadota bacterium]|nr:UTP--glucose-1-phosphate uridylyltransferase GalU [Pseudomonadota bacterium]
MSRSIRKAVLPVAGLGTRFLPATRAMPKEMLSIVDRPVIQLVVDEAREAGIEHFVFVTGRNKGVIEDHFDRQYELEDTLERRGKVDVRKSLADDTPRPGTMSFTRQQEPLGLGHAVWCARNLIGSEPFALLLPDMLMHGKQGCLAQMVAVYGQTGGNIVAVEEVAPEQVSQYGVVGIGKPAGDAFAITRMVEKPARDAPSNLIISGRYILQPEIFSKLEHQATGAGGEIQLTDAMVALLAEQPFYGYRFKGTTFDCGDRLGFLMANVVYGLDRQDVGEKFRALLLRHLDAAGPVRTRSDQIKE